MDRPLTGSLASADLEAVFVNFDKRIDREAAVSAQFRQNLETTTGLVYGYVGGLSGPATARVAVPDGTVTLAANDISYVERDPATGEVTANTDGFTAGLKPMAQVTTDGGSITDVLDVRSPDDGGAGSSAWPDITGTPTTLAGYGITDAASDTEVAAEVATLEAADIALQAATEGVADDLTDHEAESAPHTGHFDVDGSKPLTGDADAGGFKISNLADPATAGDAATKSYVDALASGLSPKANVKAATTADIALSGAQTIDAVAVGIGDRVLVKDQVTQSENGIYVADAGPWARAADADTVGEMPAGTAVTVLNGSANKFKKFVVTTAATTLDTDPIIWSLDSASGAGGTTTIANVGGGAAIWKALSGSVNYLRTIVAGSNKLTVTEGTDTVSIDVVEANLTHDNIGGTLGVVKGGTGVTAAALGDLVYGSGVNTRSTLGGNTTTARKWLRQTGTGSVSAAPAWDVLLGADLPVMVGSGPSHAAGAVPDPGATAGAARFLNEDGTWKNLPSSLGAVSGSGNGAAGRVGVWSDANTLNSDAGLNWDGVNNRLGINTNTTPIGEIEVARDGEAAIIAASTYGNAFGGAFVGRAARGTLATPTALQTGDRLGSYGGRGYDGSAWAPSSTAGMGALAAEDWTPTAHGTSWLFTTTPNGSTTPRSAALLDESGVLRLLIAPLEVKEQSGTPSTPPSGYGAFYAKSDGKAYFLNDSGVETELGAGGGGGGSFDIRQAWLMG